MNTKKLTDTLVNVINFLGKVLMTIFAGLFGLCALGALITSITDGGFIGVIGCVACAFASTICWSMRRG